MDDIEDMAASLTALDHMNNQYQMRVTTTLTAPFPTMLSLPAIVSGDGLQPFDVCGLTRQVDTTDSEDSLSDNANKLIKNEINISRTLGLKKRVNKEEIKQKFVNLENEHKKIHTQIKSLQSNILRKEKTVTDLSVENAQLNEKYEALINEIEIKNSNLLQCATSNYNLEKQIEKKNVEISQLHSKCEKCDQVQINLLKDMEFYKAEITQYKEQLNGNEELKKKYNEIKRDNVKLGKKFRELKSSDAENQQKALSYSVLQKKFDSLHSENVKYRMENKRLKTKQYTLEQELLLHQELHGSLKSVEKENVTLKETVDNSEVVNTQLQDELQNIRQDKERLQMELKIKDDIIRELKEKMSTTSNTLDGLKSNCESTERYADLLVEQINSYKMKCDTLESELDKLRESRSDSPDEVQILREEVNRLKIRLGDMVIHRDDPSDKTGLQSQTIQTEQMYEHCTNCHFLRQEVEKLGYANLRLHKEKLNLKANFQKLSVKTSKLEIKMEELSADKKLTNNTSCIVERKRSRDFPHRDVLIQQNLILSKKLKDVVENYDKLLNEYILLQQDKYEVPSTCVRSSTIIQELQNHISSSQYAINTIEHKLNEEEGKLHASLYHLRTFKNKLSERKMTLK